MEHVVIGMDPHMRSVTIEVITGTEQVLANHRLDTAAEGFTQLLRCARQWPDRLWAVEGCNGIGRHVASRLVMAGETVVDVPPKLSARLRMFDTRQGRKTDPDDAHAIALVALRMNGLRPVELGDHPGVVLTQGSAAVGENPQQGALRVVDPPATPRTHPWRRQEGPVRRPGPETALHSPSP